MEELLNKLYSYEYFGIYLTISIVVLVILFFVILFFGKKDKKEREIIATKKLQQINEEAFKEESIEEKVEVNETNEITNVEQNVISEEVNEMPLVEEVPSIMNTIEETNDFDIPEPVLPVVEENNEVLNINETEEQQEEVVEEESVINEEFSPILEKIEEKPLIFNDEEIEEPVVPVIEQINENNVLEKVEEEIEVPTFNFDEVVKTVEETKKNETYTRGPQIFSSVYVPEKKEEKIEEPKIEIPEVKEVKDISDDLDIELPTLKKDVVVEDKEEVIPEEENVEEKIELPELNDYDLDSLSGETYTIK